MVPGDLSFTVSINKEEKVAAMLPMQLQEHRLPLSNLDLLLPPVDVGVFFCYKKPLSKDPNEMVTFGSIVRVLKKALAQTLVSYYALAGEVVINSVGVPEILCSNRGVDFLQAFANVALRDLNLYIPDESIEGKLVPQRKSGVLSVQATELKCGGLVVACTFDHRIADAYSTNMFLVSWAEIAQSKPISLLPCFDRSLLNPRQPRFVELEQTLDGLYAPVSKLPPRRTRNDACDDHLISRIYYVTSDQLNQLQSLASGSNACKRTKLESFSAFLWKILAQCDSIDDSKMSKMGIVVDGRARLSLGDRTHKSKLMNSYFGNVLSIPFCEQRINELIEKSLFSVADQVHGLLENAVTRERFLGLIDWVEMHKPERALARIYSNGSEDGPAIVVSSGQRFPISKVDFGWGKPAFGSYHFPWGGDAGYVMQMPSPAENGDWVVYMHLLEKQLDLIESEASHVLRPFTSDYLNQ